MGEIQGNLKLVGVQGFIEGEEFTLKPGESLVIGRSRSCDISLRNCEKYIEIDPSGKDVGEHFRTVSRQHAKITYKSPKSITVEDLSSNGTFLDGKRLQKSIEVTDATEQDHLVTLGSQESFRIEFRQIVKRKKKKVIELEEGATPPPGAKLVEEEVDDEEDDIDIDIDEVEDIDEIDEIEEIDEVEDIDEIEEMDDIEFEEPSSPTVDKKKPIAKQVSDAVMKSYEDKKSKGPGKKQTPGTTDSKKQGKVLPKKGRLNRRLQRGR